ncbi:hypothetical protein L9F63_005074 [Diploptera punctata]|uniref:Small ribosomal subunit protein uS7m n=1 Tax=Diploptera punctata TaxID=6984 RepID=A0AAD8E6S9_DIPPU|nr:hypothetical protein L9F63_005074 [Diploptera punctata]
MAAFNKIICKNPTQYIFLNSVSALYNCLGVSKNFSQYGKQFVDPVFKKEEQDILYETGEIEKKTHVPIKAALTDATCSVFHDELVRKFVNLVMRKGKKVLAREMVEKAFENVKRIQLEKYNSTTETEKKEAIVTDPLKIFHDAIANCKPVLQLTPIKRGGATYQVPVPITENRSRFLAMKWIILAAKDKERRIHFPEKLAWELVDASKNQGRVVKQKQDLHRQCEANRAYAHYRWG